MSTSIQPSALTTLDAFLREALADFDELDASDLTSDDLFLPTDDRDLNHGTITVGNLSRGEIDGIRVTRPGPFGNPFKAEQHGRIAALALYERYLRLAMREGWPPLARATRQLVQRVKAGENLTLLCWCAPKRCHAEIIRKVVYELARASQ